MLHPEQTSQIGTDSRTGEHNRCLCPDRTTKPDCYGTGYNGRPRIMPLDAPLPTGYGIQYFGDPMTDIIFYDIAHKQPCQKDSYHRIYQILVISFRRIKVLRKKILYPVYQHFQYQCGKCRKDANQETKEQDKPFLLNIPLTPNDKALQPPSFFSNHLLYSRIILITPPLSNFIMLEGFGLLISS